MTDPIEPTVLARREGRAGLLTLNRPRALNALDTGMIAHIADAIAAWRDDPAVALVVLEGAGGRAFCAGGDVRAIRTAAIAGDRATVAAFFVAEYAMNQAIADFPKPWVSLIDGVCMGGGIGLSVHGRPRVVTEHALLAMPETAIALFPDVGTSFVLPRLPGAMGMWIALTGARLQGAEAVAAGLADAFVPRAGLPALRDALVAGDVGAVAAAAAPVPTPGFAAQREAIDRCFGAGDLVEILAALGREGTPWANEQLAILGRMSPTSLAVSVELLRRGAGSTLTECLARELRLTAKVIHDHPDFTEGVRAVLVDKDAAPRWTPPSVAALDPAAITAMFD